MPLRWREDVLMQLKSGIASIAQKSDVGERLRMTPLERVAPLYEAISFAMS